MAESLQHLTASRLTGVLAGHQNIGDTSAITSEVKAQQVKILR
jgi:hypothetical protein